MVDNADCKGNVEAVGKGQIVGARPGHFDRWKAREIAPRSLERALINIDRAALACPVSHRPEAVAAHAAPNIEKALAVPILWREVDRPAAKLFFVLGHNLARFPAVEVVRSSAYDLPFADRFDIAFAIGVIHHLEDPQRALQRMARAVKPGGRVLIWVYGREGNRWLLVMLDPLRRALLSRMPIALVHHLSLYPAAFLWLALKLGLRPSEYVKLISRFRLAHLRSIVFDQMLPRIAHYWPRDQVVELMREAGLEDIRIAAVNEMSWSAIGTRATPSNEIERVYL